MVYFSCCRTVISVDCMKYMLCVVKPVSNSHTHGTIFWNTQ